MAFPAIRGCRIGLRPREAWAISMTLNRNDDMLPSLRYPVLELGPGVAFGHADDSTFLSAWNYRGLMNSRDREVRVVDSEGEEYMFSGAEAVPCGGRLKWWLTRIMGKPFRICYDSVRHVGHLAPSDFKSVALSIVKSDRSFFDSGGDTEGIIRRIETAESHRSIIEVLL